MVGLCDNNAGRLNLCAEWTRERGAEVPLYSDEQFDQMVADTKPDVVIVT